MFPRTPWTLQVIGAVVALVIPAAVAGNDFVEGDAFLLNSSIGEVYRVDPTAPSTEFFAAVPLANSSTITYDPFRDRLVVIKGVFDELYLVDAAGGVETVSLAWDYTFDNLAPTGDGRVYIGSNNGQIGVLDECGELHVVLHPDCDVPFQLPSPIVPSEMLYHEPTNSLFYAHGANNIANVARITLSANGTRVTGEIETNTFFVSPSGHGPTGLSCGPDGDLLLSVDTNDNDFHPRLIRVDPDTMEMVAFADTATAAQFAASFHSGLDVALFVSSNSIWAIPEGGTATQLIGLPITPFSMCVIGETVGGSPVSMGSADLDDNGIPDACDIASGAVEDCNDNGVPDLIDIATGTSGDSDGDGIPDECDGIDPTAFEVGDIYTIGFTPTGTGLQRTDPITGCVYDLADLSGVQARLTYDPFRDRIVVLHFAADILYLVTHDGIVDTLTFDWADNSTTVCATGDGRFFLASSQGHLVMLDLCGEVHVVMDESGAEPLQLAAAPHALLYDYDLNELYVADGAGNTANVHRLPLSPAGTQLTGVIVSNSYFVSPSGHEMRGFSSGPGNDLLLSVDTNDNDLNPRFLVVDTGTLVMYPYCETATAAQFGGSYHGGLDQAVLAHGGVSRIFLFDEGSTSGDLLTPGPLQAPVHLVVIGESVHGDVPPAVGGEDCNENGFVDACDIATGVSQDCNGNGIPDECDIANGSSLDTNGDGRPDECEQPFVRGDVDGNGIHGLGDAVQFLNYLFLNGSVPCLDSCDFSDDGEVQLNDVILLLEYMFVAGGPPPAPFPGCGLDPTIDPGFDLGCEGPLGACP